jgi:hypothetical protein
LIVKNEGNRASTSRTVRRREGESGRRDQRREEWVSDGGTRRCRRRRMEQRHKRGERPRRPRKEEGEKIGTYEIEHASHASW